jgi:hypothetical protein
LKERERGREREREGGGEREREGERERRETFEVGNILSPTQGHIKSQGKKKKRRSNGKKERKKRNFECIFYEMVHSASLVVQKKDWP